MVNDSRLIRHVGEARLLSGIDDSLDNPVLEQVHNHGLCMITLLIGLIEHSEKKV